MSTIPIPLSAVKRYETALLHSRSCRLPQGYAEPRPPSDWPPENRALLERYQQWLVEDGAGVTCIPTYYIPMAGHALGFNLIPHSQLDLEQDLERAMAFVQAKQPSDRWAMLCRNALNRFRRFLRQERGEREPAVNFKSVNIARYQEGLPGWLVEQLTHLQQSRQPNWRPSRLSHAILRFWSSHTRLWLWLFAHYPIETVGDVKRAAIFAYIDHRLADGGSPQTVNQELRTFQATLHFLREREFVVPHALLRLPGLKEPDRLPRFLTDEQVGKLRRDFEQRVQVAETAVQLRNVLLDRAIFYLLWQGGLRLGEVEELTLDDLNLEKRQIVVRQGKGLQDRTIYLTDAATAAVQSWLAVRGEGTPQDAHLFLFRHKPLCKDFIRGRLQAAGKRAGVKVTPHQLRHTYATQLVNAGCRITTIQALLGHKHLDTTMIYARVYDSTAAEDYFTAMAAVEERLKPHLNQPPEPVEEDGLPTLLERLEMSELNGRQQALLAELRDSLNY